MSIRKSAVLFGVALSMAAFMSGCSSDSKGGGSSDSVPLVGDPSCFACHSANTDPLTGVGIVAQYTRSLHGELGCESCHGGGAMHNGVGPFPYTLNSETSDDQKAQRCVMCHDGVTQYMGKTAPLSSSSNFANGNHANPFSAEEAKEAKCARCHSHEGSIIYGNQGYTGDKNILNNAAYQPVLARDPETFQTIRCATCHEHGGNVRTNTTRNLAGDIVTWDPDGNKVTSQFDLCTSCHTMNTNEGMLIGSGNILSIANSAGGFKNVTTAPFYHDTAWYRTLPSTHYDQPASGTNASGTIIEGYNMRKTVKNPCYDCHGHEFKANTRALADRPERGTTTFTDWAMSGHAGGLLKQKVAAAVANGGNTRSKAQVDAVMKAGANEASGAAWSHYNWDDTSTRGSCQRCHTSTGASNFMKNPATYDATGNGNSFAHLVKWTKTGGSTQQELLYCWGCHEKAGNGKLYTPGARVETYDAVNNPGTGTTGTTVTVSYPNINGSNVCMTCHIGREIGETIKNTVDADGILGFINSHYLTAGAQLFAQSGYTYPGLNYANPSFYKHDQIGSATAPGTGLNGPCVGCHMSSPNKHKFTNVSTSQDPASITANGGEIAAITSTACATCHAGGFALTPASLNAEEEEYTAALAGLSAALATKGINFYAGAYPYFFTAPYVVGGSNTGLTNWAAAYGVANWQPVMGAAFNLNLLAHDPGGFAHNRFYAKRLIWDSIDYIDDGIINNSTPATLPLVLPAGQVLTDAQAYLGTTRP